MPLTPFGKACRGHRVRMRVVMADQSAAIELTASTISQIEVGAIQAPEGYITKLAKWMQLDALEEHQLRNLAKLKQKKLKKVQFKSSDDLISLLSREPNKDGVAGAEYEERKAPEAS